jgi:hypothetical protein
MHSDNGLNSIPLLLIKSITLLCLASNRTIGRGEEEGLANLGRGENVGKDLLVALDGLPGAGAQRGAEIAETPARRQHLPGHHPRHRAVEPHPRLSSPRPRRMPSPAIAATCRAEAQQIKASRRYRGLKPKPSFILVALDDLPDRIGPAQVQRAQR